MKRAQLTLMIITGIVFLVAVAMVIWIGSKTATTRTEPAAEQQRLRQVAVQPVTEYIRSCLDMTTMSGLELLGKQGGVLYRAQGGLTPNPQPYPDLGVKYVEYEGLNVSYLITRPTQNIGTLYYAQPPEYPWVAYPYAVNKSDNSLRTVYTGYFGKSLLPPLFKPGNNSIQEQLESYISFNLPKCTVWKTFENQGLSIESGKPNITVMIAENRTQIETEQYFSVLANWQVNITDKTTTANTSISEFSISYPVHLAKFYLFVQGLINSDIRDSSFDPLKESATATPVYIEKSIYKNEDQSTDDVIIVQDTESMLRGKPMEFWILRQNRYPALVWINQTRLNDFVFRPMGYCDDKKSISIDGNLLSIIFADSPSSEWTTTLSAVDPDEDIVAFRTKPDDGKIGKHKITSSIASPYKVYVYASDGSNIEDFQILDLTLTGCPQ